MRRDAGEGIPTILWKNNDTCMVVTAVTCGKPIECGQPASVRMDWMGLPPLFMCCDCYERMRRREGKKLPSITKMRLQSLRGKEEV